MTQPIDIAYVELRARGEDDAAREVKKAVDDMERDVDRASRDMEVSLSTAFKDAADSIERELERSGSILSKSAVSQRKALQGLGDTATNVFDEIGDAVEGAADALTGGGGGGGGGGIVSSLAEMGNQLRGISALVPPPILLGLAAAIPAIIALGGALADLSAIALALPAALAVLGASFATLKVAFSGFGETVSALASGDLEKINEAMKNLAPAAQTVAREINALRAPFSALRKEVQQSFFAPLQGDLTRLANAVLPTLRGGMRDVAASFGELGSAILDLLGQNDLVEGLGDIFESTARIVRNLSPEIVDFLGTLFGVIEHGLPFVERAFDKLGDGLQAVTDFLGGSLKTGDFEKFLNDAFATLGDLFDLTKAVFELLGAVFGDAGDEGRTFIQSLTEMTKGLTDFFNSADGQEILQRIVDLLPVLVESLKAGATVLGFLAVGLNGMYKFLEAVGKAAVVAGIAIGKFFSTLWDWTKRAAGAVADFFGEVGNFFQGVGGAIGDAFNAVVSFGGQVIDFVTALPGKILEALQALPGTLAQFFINTLNQVAYDVGFILGTIVQFFIDLPGRIVGALNALISFVVTTFTTLRDQSIALALQLFNAVVQFFVDLPERASAALNFIIEKVTSIFQQTRDGATSTVSNMINSIFNFFNSLPGRVTGALNSFRDRVLSILRGIRDAAFNLGKDIINGVKDGIGAAIDGGVQAAKNAARRMAQGFMDALRIGSPSKLMAEQVGIPMMQGIGVGFQQGAPLVQQEIESATQSFVPRALGGQGTAQPTSATGSGTVITFDSGAVQVVFEGVTPSDEEARRTGNAVGEGIAQTLSRRNVRTLVRTT